MTARIGTAGWSIPRAVAEHFPASGTALQRYAARFNCAEINSSFYRPHRRSTYERWAASVPEGFRFAVKMPKTISHEKKLVGAAAELDRFIDEAAGLGEAHGPLLLQLPPSFAFDRSIAVAFFDAVRNRTDKPLACEPRHPSWFTSDMDALLATHRVARVAADPARVPAAGTYGGWMGLRYRRLHGAPRVYYSAYDGNALADLADVLARPGAQTWVIFDNTASGAAAANALELARLCCTATAPMA